MTVGAASTTARAVAWLAVVLVIALIALGGAWYGFFSADVYQRIWRDILDRPAGPMMFRFILQPCMAAIAAMYDGLQDARLRRAPYVWTMLHDTAERGERLREGLISTARIILLGIGMDSIYQYKVLNTFYPGEAALIALLLAFIPYLILRGPAARVARWWLGHNSAGSAS